MSAAVAGITAFSIAGGGSGGGADVAAPRGPSRSETRPATSATSAMPPPPACSPARRAVLRVIESRASPIERGTAQESFRGRAWAVAAVAGGEVATWAVAHRQVFAADDQSRRV